MNKSTIAKAVIILSIVSTIATFAPETAAQSRCGAEGQRPCRIWERVPSCNKGLRENFRLDMCTGPRTQVNLKGQYIPRNNTKPTSLRLCNVSSKPMVYAAVAYWTDSQYGWASEGWMQIPSGRCDNFDLGDNYSGAVYVYGSSNDGTEWDGRDADFCVKTYDAFGIDNSDKLQCRSREYSIVGMVRHNVAAGRVNTFSFAN